MAARMKKATFLISVMAAGLSSGCLEKPDSTPGTASTILFRYHFLGTTQLARTTNNVQLPAILALPATREFTEEVLQKLSRRPEELWRKFLPAGATTQPALIRPLLDDLASAESFAEVHGPLHRGESVFAIELNDGRADIWRKNLGEILTGWKLGNPNPVNLGESKGWEMKNAQAPGLIQFVRAGKWVLIGLGQERLTLLPGLLEQITKTGRPIVLQSNVPLELEADCPRLGDWLPALSKCKLPPLHLTLTGRGGYLRSEARLTFSEPLPLRIDPWKFPTNFVHDPIISFTVARGIAPLLSQVKGVPALGLNPLPNQVCAWGPATIHTDTRFSVPMANPSNVLYQLGPKLPDFTTGLLSQPIGGFALVTNRSELFWQGWPVLLPYVQAVRDAGTEYLVGGVFPMGPRLTNPPPPELFGQLKERPKLVYYDWEITQERLSHAEQMQQLWDMMNHLRFPPTNAPGQKWLLAIAPHLGNTTTEATLTSPTELTFVRKSDLGFTGIELATLARWVASAGFPWSFEQPAPTSTHTNAPGSKTNPPATPTLAPGAKKP